jgi:hypothetical protein
MIEIAFFSKAFLCTSVVQDAVSNVILRSPLGVSLEMVMPRLINKRCHSSEPLDNIFYHIQPSRICSAGCFSSSRASPSMNPS